MDTFGDIEAGVDGGGLFKDFMENLIKEGFDPRIGLFKATPDQKLYPNPAAATIEPNAFALFEFMGKMVGKALYEVLFSQQVLPTACFHSTFAMGTGTLAMFCSCQYQYDIMRFGHVC